jgi:hypothetical protein
VDSQDSMRGGHRRQDTAERDPELSCASTQQRGLSCSCGSI